MEEKKDVLNEETIAQDTSKQELPTQENPETTDQIKSDSSNTENKSDELKLTESGEILIDNTLDVEPKVQVPLDHKAKLKEPLTKKKKIMIACIAAAVVVVLFCSIFFPCFFYFKGKIMVNDASDFNTEKTAGKYFVLKKDIVVDSDLDLTNIDSSIDLNGHNLTVNGKLIISTDSSNTINIGTKNKNSYKAKGILKANDIEINAPNANLNIASTTIILGSLNVADINNIDLSGVSIVNSSTINGANEVNIKEAIAAANTDITFTFSNCTSVNIYGKIEVENTIFENSNIVSYSSSTMHSIQLNADSTAQIYGAVDKITGGKKVAMLDNYSCPIYENVILLAIYKPYTSSFTTTNCSKVVYIEKLDTPVDLIVNEDEGSFKATCARIEGFPYVKYNFTYDGTITKNKSSGNIDDHFYDITSLLKQENGAATISISAYAVGNYNFDTLDYDSLNDGEYLYVDSDVKTITYTYSLVLSTPKNLSALRVDDKVLLSFNQVEFADFYTIYIDGAKVIETENATDTEIDITSYVDALGYHSIRITANSHSKELKTSKEAMCSYKNTEKLEAVSNIEAKYDAASKKINISFEGNENAKIYLIQYNGKIYRTTNTSFSIAVEEGLNPIGDSISIVAEGYNYYLNSKPTPATVS